MAKNKSRGKIGLVPWILNLIAIFLGLFPVWGELAAIGSGGSWQSAGDNLQRLYNPMNGDRAALARGYGSLLGGLVFRIAGGELAKRTRNMALVPKIG